jgi:hypothetical protein
VALIIALMKEAVNTSETSVSFYETTRSNVPEDSNLRCFLMNPVSFIKDSCNYDSCDQLLHGNTCLEEDDRNWTANDFNTSLLRVEECLVEQ